LSCEEKRTRKGAGNVAKNGKALLVKYAKNVAKKFECQCRISAYCPAFRYKKCSETGEW